MTDDLTPQQRAETAILSRLLASPAVWSEPGDELEDAVVDAVLTASPVHAVSAEVTPLPAPRSRRRHSWRWVAGATTAVAAAVAIVVGVTTTRDNDRPAFESNLTATALGHGADASVEMYPSDAGFRITLDAHGLPLLPSDEYYQAWLWSDRRTPVPIGTFSSSNGHVTLWSGVSAKGFPTVTVTIERTDKNLAPSARRVLSGRLHAT